MVLKNPKSKQAERRDSEIMRGRAVIDTNDTDDTSGTGSESWKTVKRFRDIRRRPPPDIKIELPEIELPDDISDVNVSLPMLAVEADLARVIVHHPKYEIGERVNGKDIYLGVWEPKDENGKSLNHIFDLYAAPEDLKTGFIIKKNMALRYDRALLRVGRLHQYVKDQNGYDATDYRCFQSEAEIYEAIRSGRSSELINWFIPTLEILRDYLYANKDKGALKGTFQDKVCRSGYAHWYWSCTEARDDSSKVYDVDFTDGYDGWGYKFNDELSTRPVRAVLRPRGC